MSSWNFHVKVNGHFSVMIICLTMQVGRLELNPWLIVGPGSPLTPTPTDASQPSSTPPTYPAYTGTLPVFTKPGFPGLEIQLSGRVLA